MILLPLFLTLYAILSAATFVTFPAITLKEILVSSATNSTDDGVPVECQQTCAPIVPLTLGNESCTASLCCNSQWEQTYYSCILCAAQIQQISDLSNAQHTLDEIYADCAQVGSPIPLLTFPGQSPNRTLPSASALSSQSMATATVSGNVTASASSASTSTFASGSSTNFTLLPCTSTTSLTASPASTSTSTQNSGSSLRNQRSILFTVFTISITFSYL